MCTIFNSNTGAEGFERYYIYIIVQLNTFNRIVYTVSRKLLETEENRIWRLSRSDKTTADHNRKTLTKPTTRLYSNIVNSRQLYSTEKSMDVCWLVTAKDARAVKTRLRRLSRRMSDRNGPQSNYGTPYDEQVK